MKLSEYVKRRNGVPFGHPDSLQYNLKRSLGAKNFASFWSFWNPIFGYYLGLKIFRPLKKVLPVALSIILTFVFCGLIHDLVTTLVRGQLSLFFSIWFLIMGTIVSISNIFYYDLSNKTWIFRASINLSIIGSCFWLTHYLNNMFTY